MLPAKAASGRLEPVTREAPMFPRDALAQGIDRGTVRARLSIDASGKVTDVEILEAQPRRVFDRAVRSALGRWTYPPGEASRTTVVEVAFQRD
ncbi:MAG: TonB family protein [Burkholderiales bacterium]|nr:TonB family protein [Burkholderiales bacterium]